MPTLNTEHKVACEVTREWEWAVPALPATPTSFSEFMTFFYVFIKFERPFYYTYLFSPMIKHNST